MSWVNSVTVRNKELEARLARYEAGLPELEVLPEQADAT